MSTLPQLTPIMAVTEPISDKQSKYIKDNHRRMSVKEMANNLKIAHAIIHDYMTAQAIPIRIMNHKKAAPKDETKPGFFNAKDMDNLFI